MWELRKLHGKVAHAPGGAMDEHGLSSAETGVLKKRLPCGQGSMGNSRGVNEVKRDRFGFHKRGLDGDIFGVGPIASVIGPGKYRVADCKIFNVPTDRGDYAGHIPTQN
jgi:hypothetical protein